MCMFQFKIANDFVALNCISMSLFYVYYFGSFFIYQQNRAAVWGNLRKGDIQFWVNIIKDMEDDNLFSKTDDIHKYTKVISLNSFNSLSNLNSLNNLNNLQFFK